MNEDEEKKTRTVVANRLGEAATMAALLERVLARVRAGGAGAPGVNVVAYSGGVDSSVVAACVHRVFPERAVAALGVSASLPRRQLEQAREVAREDIGIPLVEVRTSEGSRPAYVANEGESCYHCKVSLYGDVLEDIRRHFGASSRPHEIRLFNGTNADDLEDPTRLGLIVS
ncbi:Hypothetical Protein FCC1311_039042 [Hondaea fermentalgiana]|uniref:Uncharacterized protein n=1 Tax=Hondaea fermentalgiana TaxID=2315210 RepID=A0A2R5GHC8_9STRA|nr:Hypothetical Protein FCC1311_039042 [Hondaea fermentalgiana]|eukprot:GBG27681.1 Hypothetical Protein FCC1311_039042 [Hondaea fermentalgiana]